MGVSSLSDDSDTSGILFPGFAIGAGTYWSLGENCGSKRLEDAGVSAVEGEPSSRVLLGIFPSLYELIIICGGRRDREGRQSAIGIVGGSRNNSSLSHLKSS